MILRVLARNFSALLEFYFGQAKTGFDFGQAKTAQKNLVRTLKITGAPHQCFHGQGNIISGFPKGIPGTQALDRSI